MADFEMICPHCHGEIVVDDDWEGLVVECPECQQSFTVKGTKFLFVCPECGTMTELPTSLQGQKYACKACCEESIAEPATEKPCPYCGNKIKLHAQICKFCKNPLNGLSAVPVLPPIAPGLTPVLPPSLSPSQNIDSTSQAPAPSGCRNAAAAILWPIAVLMWLASIVCCFIEVELGLVMFAVAFFLSMMSLLLKKNEKFELLPDEQILSTCRVVDEEDEVTHFTRLTNKRIVLSAIEYPFLPILIGALLEGMAKPKRITYACGWDDVIRIEMELKGPKMKKYHTVLETTDVKYYFKPAPELVDFWQSRRRFLGK